MRLLTKEQVFRAFRKVLRSHPTMVADVAEEILFNYMGEKLLNYTFFNIIEDLYEYDYITYEEMEVVRDAVFLYYGDLVQQFIREEF